MKEGWEYKKLGEIGVIVTGSTPSTKDSENYNSRDYCFVKPSDIPKTGTNVLTDTEFYISKKAYNSSRKLPKGSVLTTCIGIIGKVGILGVDAICNQQINAIIPNPQIIISPFLAYSILYNRKKLEKKANAPIVPIINKKDFANTIIEIPSISEQQHIVEELDLLSSIIEKKKAQLKELDNLAQSIFYEMFGDPITNEKGWEVKKLGEMGILARGISKHRPRNAPELLGGTMPLIQTGDIANSDMYINSYHNTYSDLGVAQSKVWKAGTLCITIAANIGKCAILGFEACFPDSVVGFTVDSIFSNNEYIFFIFCRLQSLLERNAPSVAQKNINLKILNDLQIPHPPLPLQELFASKIQSIEHQKALIKQSITEVETLFNSRMDYYFN